ncbi:MAG: hypothetical protein NT062_09510, partial [Proteobacteria bacterium]|nr:hypothetical protein [Pseudomonadota bacterium]
MMDEAAGDDDDDDLPGGTGKAGTAGNAALTRAHAAKPDELAALRGDLEWTTTQTADPAAWLALGIVYFRLGDRASAESTLLHAQQRIAE